MNENKPILGVKPYYIAAEARIAELADCIRSHVFTDHSMETGFIIEWAKEIVEQCKLVNSMREQR